jgi:hypothetical protein
LATGTGISGKASTRTACTTKETAGSAATGSNGNSIIE